MNLFKYLESRFATLSLEVQQEFSVLKDAETKAVYDLVAAIRKVLKWFMYIKVSIQWILMIIHILPKPLTAKEVIANAQKPTNNEVVQEPKV